MDFKDFCSQNQNLHKEKSLKKEALFEENKEEAKNIKEQIDKYSNKSQDELMKEFLKASQNMNIDNKKIEQITNQIGPMLSEQQREKMKTLLNQIRK